MARYRCWSPDLGIEEKRAKREEARDGRLAAENFALAHHDEPEDGSRATVYVREADASEETMPMVYQVTFRMEVSTSARLVS